ncbi:hypothetical protein ASZ90_009623 [hydrocarbon metagenome]|uniref:Uncharacterized protein n=1 Tax=hydrocarbon metagenome TaxID=938273 RepID=A0A0W8FIB1_9ZZZZ
MKRIPHREGGVSPPFGQRTMPATINREQNHRQPLLHSIDR